MCSFQIDVFNKDGFEKFSENPVWLRNCLLPLPFKNTVASGMPKPTTLCRALLSIGQLQPRLATALLERMPEFATAEEEDGEKGAPPPVSSRMQTIPQLIINQFRWLDHVSWISIHAAPFDAFGSPHTHTRAHATTTAFFFLTGFPLACSIRIPTLMHSGGTHSGGTVQTFAQLM